MIIQASMVAFEAVSAVALVAALVAILGAVSQTLLEARRSRQ